MGRENRDQRLAKYGDWMNDPSPDPPGQGTNLALEDVQLRKSSQFGTQISKKGASRYEKLLPWVAMVMAMPSVVLLAGDMRSNLPVLAVLLLIFASIWILLEQIERRDKRLRQAEAKTVEVEDEMALFPAADFIRGMNKDGVDVILGGGEFGPRSTSKLRFPATVFRKHLVDSMVFGYRRAVEIEEDRKLHQIEEEEVRPVFEKIAGNWIEQMMQGTR